MTSKDNLIGNAAALLRKAEDIAREKAVMSPDTLETLSPEETRKILHELRVHQIELEMQNEELLRAQSELEVSRTRYFELYDLAPVGYCTISEKGLILESNLTAAKLLDITRDALTRQPISRFIHKEDQDIYYYLQKQLVEESVSRECDLRMVTNDGTHFWAHLTTTAGQDSDGNSMSRILINDITDRKRAEEALNENQSRLEMIFGAIPYAIFEYDAKLRLVRANTAALKATGISTLDITRDQAVEKLRFTNLDGSTLKVEDLPTSRALRGDTIANAPYLITTADGDKRVISAYAAPLYKDGKIHSVIALWDDITERKRVEKALQDSNRLLQTTLDALSANIAMLDEHGTVMLINKAWRDFAEQNGIVAGTASEGSNYLDVCDRAEGKNMEEARPFADGIRAVLSGAAESFILEYPCHSPCKERWFTGCVTTIQGVGPRRVVVAHENITGRKLAEEKIHQLYHLLIQAQETERHLISYELHESIAQNLSVLKINTDTIYNDPSMTSPELQGKLVASSSLISQSIADIRNLAYELRLPGLDEMGLVKALEIYCEEVSEKSKVKIDFQSAGMSPIDLPRKMEIHIFRLIQEGLSNIHKHADADHATIRLLGSSPNIILHIEDNGRGFDVKQQELLFADSKKMGINSMQERVRLLQGKMNIQSQSMEGTKISIKIPISGNCSDKPEKHKFRIDAAIRQNEITPDWKIPPDKTICKSRS